MATLFIVINLIVGFSYSKAIEIMDNSSLKLQENDFLLVNNPPIELIDKDRLNIFRKETMTLTNMITEHRVEERENLWKIARLYDIDIDTLIGANDINDINKIRPGDIIKILPVKGILNKINPGENLSMISQKFNIDMEVIIELNGIKDPDRILPV